MYYVHDAAHSRNLSAAILIVVHTVWTAVGSATIYWFVLLVTISHLSAKGFQFVTLGAAQWILMLHSFGLANLASGMFADFQNRVSGYQDLIVPYECYIPLVMLIISPIFFVSR